MFQSFHDPVQRTPGVPAWFTRVLHIRYVRRCRRIGHNGKYVCGRCGQVLASPW